MLVCAIASHLKQQRRINDADRGQKKISFDLKKKLSAFFVLKRLNCAI